MQGCYASLQNVFDGDALGKECEPHELSRMQDVFRH